MAAQDPCLAEPAVTLVAGSIYTAGFSKHIHPGRVLFLSPFFFWKSRLLKFYQHASRSGAHCREAAAQSPRPVSNELCDLSGHVISFCLFSREAILRTK